jgi:hypothetical protein
VKLPIPDGQSNPPRDVTTYRPSSRIAGISANLNNILLRHRELDSPYYDAMPEGDSSSVIPAQLSFLAIYNPQLGTTDETIREQVVFYTSRPDLSRRQGSLTATNEGQEDNGIWNERLRQIGLAQGMVSFARWELRYSPI